MNLVSQEVLRARYLQKDKKGRVIEKPDQMFKRVAKAIAEDSKQKKEFYEMMRNLEFLPNSPTLMNAGTAIGQLSACFVLPIDDSIESIFTTLKNMALIHQSGGGTGFNFSHVRPKGDIVNSTKGKASGPVSFIEVYDKATEVVKQGGRRRGANMAILNYDHPDIEQFVTAKKQGGLQNFNLSVAVDKGFFSAKTISLKNPRNGKTVKKIPQKRLFDLIIESAWMTGEPGLLFFDEINKRNPIVGEIESVNPCAEQPLMPYESCNLGSVNLTRFAVNGEVDWLRLREVVRLGVEFLDNAIDANKYPLKKIKEMTLANRKIGLGVMGFADMLTMLGIRYDSEKALHIAERVMSFIQKEARKRSSELGRQKGNFPNIKISIWKYHDMRNATVTTIAPTGSISLIAGCSSGIEPIYAPRYYREVIGKKMMFEKKISDTALKIKPEWHVKMQAAFQKHVDNAVSKTVNLSHSATKEDVKKVFLMAHELECKGITVYREGSKKGQVCECI